LMLRHKLCPSHAAKPPPSIIVGSVLAKTKMQKEIDYTSMA
jgi:hypothetical protein